MKLQASLEAPADDLFRNRLDKLIDRRHEPVRPADLIDRERFDSARGKVPRRLTGNKPERSSCDY